MRIGYVLMIALFFSFISECCGQKSSVGYDKEKKEIESFMSNYKRLLQNAKFDSVALLYVDTGCIFMGNGQIDIQTIDSIKSSYGRMSKEPNDFRWENNKN